MPGSIYWYDFLVRMGWQRKDVLYIQPADWVHTNYEVFKYELEVGMLDRFNF
ncbi:MAG TPA: hypothetical protein VIY48_11975 [Candidatus Paceibacterota bacterium]